MHGWGDHSLREEIWVEIYVTGAARKREAELGGECKSGQARDQDLEDSVSGTKPSVYDPYMERVDVLHSYGMSFVDIARLLFAEGLRPPFSQFTEEKMLLASLAGALRSRYSKLKPCKRNYTIAKTFKSGDWTPEMVEKELWEETNQTIHFEG